MKIGIIGASTWVNRLFEGCGNYQWAREFLKNSREAKAKRVEFGIEWQGVEKLGVYRRTICDDGIGMSAQELNDFFSTFGAGSKKIGGVHDNFGVGAKIASLPWNPEGLVVVSYRDSKASMIQIVLDTDTNEYDLVEFNFGSGYKCVIDPTEIDWADGINWAEVAPDWCRAHGTVIVLLGSEEYPDTVLGNYRADEREIKGLSIYLNTRFWDLSDMEVTVAELRSDKKNAWPANRDEKDNTKRPNNRTIHGAKHYLTEVKSTSSKLVATDVTLLDQNRVGAEWYLWEGERPNIETYAKRNGYVAVRYKDELYELTTAKVMFRNFGVSENKVQQNLTIILEPELYEPPTHPWGVHPDHSRNRLIFTGGGEKGVNLPFSDWAGEFAQLMPEPILKAIKAARGDVGGSLDNEDYRKRLQDKFGNRWTVRRMVMAQPHAVNKKPATVTNEEVPAPIQLEPKNPNPGVKKPKKKAVVQVQLLAKAGGKGQAIEMDVPVDIPKFRYVGEDEFEKPWHMASWNPHDSAGPTVLLNRDSAVLQEVIKFHQEQYADVYADEVRQIVMLAYGEIAVAKVAHAQKLMSKVPEQDLDANYRNEPALTLALMGLLAEDQLVGQRLGKLGNKKKTAA